MSVLSPITIILRKWCHNINIFWELASYHGGKTVHTGTLWRNYVMLWRNYVTVTLCICGVLTLLLRPFSP